VRPGLLSSLACGHVSLFLGFGGLTPGFRLPGLGGCLLSQRLVSALDGQFALFLALFGKRFVLIRDFGDLRVGTA
jgi:hypothetical protein